MNSNAVFNKELDCNALYQIEHWSDGFFKINQKGHLTAVDKESGLEMDIKAVIDTILERGIEVPLVIRFHDILTSRIKELNTAFEDAIEKAEYRADYFGVYPIKVNQMREVVEEVVSAGKKFRYGLEAGSKAELLAVLAYQNNSKAVIILNGYKDEEFLKLALLGSKLGHEIHIVIESIKELQTLITISKKLNVKPNIGFRLKIQAKGYGRWEKSSGENSKFGLTAVDIMNAIYLLKLENMLETVGLLHFHMGSQVSDIATFREAMNEGLRMYKELLKLNVPIKYLDLGGGLAVDYDGSVSTNYSSKNYSLEEYCYYMVQSVKDFCSAESISEPNLITESGRFISAHHSCIVTSVLDVISSNDELFHIDSKNSEDHMLYQRLERIIDNEDAEVCLEHWHELQQIKIEINDSFKYGVIDLPLKALLDHTYQKALEVVYHYMCEDPEEYQTHIEEIANDSQSQYLCNFSVFQSAADSWAINQILPVMPIHRLNEQPDASCTIADISCDSDGKIDTFLHHAGIQTQHLPVHRLVEGEPYYLGIFLTGAYQDVMGDMHNLFGRLNEVHIYSDKEVQQNFYIEEFIPGSSKETVLSTMQYSRDVMLEKINAKLEKQIDEEKLNRREAKTISSLYAQSLSDYTYLVDDH